MDPTDVLDSRAMWPAAEHGEFACRSVHVAAPRRLDTRSTLTTHLEKARRRRRRQLFCAVAWTTAVVGCSSSATDSEDASTTSRRPTTALTAASTLASSSSSSATSAAASSATGGPPSASTSAALPGSPVVGLVAIGHSALTGENSDPSRPGQDARQNSWATGTSPDVNSIYLRLVAAEPETQGHVANTAAGGAVAQSLATQARAALTIVGAPQLVIVETIDNDIRCDGTDAAHVPEFGASVEQALALITSASPQTKILLVGQPGRPSPAFLQDYIAAHPAAKPQLTGSGICDFFDSSGALDQEHLATLTGIIDSYETEENRVCAKFAQCSTDGGARRTVGRSRRLLQPRRQSSQHHRACRRGRADVACRRRRPAGAIRLSQRCTCRHVVSAMFSKSASEASRRNIRCSDQEWFGRRQPMTASAMPAPLSPNGSGATRSNLFEHHRVRDSVDQPRDRRAVSNGSSSLRASPCRTADVAFRARPPGNAARAIAPAGSTAILLRTFRFGLLGG